MLIKFVLSFSPLARVVDGLIVPAVVADVTTVVAAVVLGLSGGDSPPGAPVLFTTTSLGNVLEMILRTGDCVTGAATEAEGVVAVSDETVTGTTEGFLVTVTCSCGGGMAVVAVACARSGAEAP